MNIPQRIDAIIDERKKLLPQINASLEKVQKARQAVDRLETYRSMQSDATPELAEKLAAISTKLFYEKQEAAIRQLEYLQKRFSRDEINISFVGRARQGKSLLLQRISGLESDVIPSSNGSHCTGTRSVISNSPGSEIKAEITFYTEQEYVGIVNAYLKKIFKADARLVSSVAEISRLNIDELKNKRPYDQETLMDELQKYVEHADELQSRLGTYGTISKDEIESYVAQYNHLNEKEKYYTYLAVKEAHIHASFPCAQCGKIVLVDTIGTGATALGVEEEMIATVKNSDVIILIKLPAPTSSAIYSEEYELVTDIADAVTPEYARQMLFWLFNRIEEGPGENSNSICRIMDQLKDKDFPIAQYLNVDCSNVKDVEDNLLIPVLEQMSANLASIDSMILNRANEQLSELEQAYHIISSLVERAMGASVNQDERRAFEQKIDATIAKTTNLLRDLYLKRDQEKTSPCTFLKEAASVKLRRIRTSAPSKETIREQLENGMINQFNALEKLTNQLRLQIINDFLELNSALDEIVLKMKRDVVHVLAEEGRLGFLVNADPNDPNFWLRAFCEKLDETEFPLLRSALKALEDFDLRMENFLIYKVRCCLTPLDWTLNPQPPQLLCGLADKEGLTDEIDSKLRSLLAQVYQDIEEELTGYYIFPNTALFAVLRDFQDRVAFASKDKRNVNKEWQYLYGYNIPIIWEEDHRNHIAKAGKAEEWNIIVKDIHACAADGYFHIGK